MAFIYRKFLDLSKEIPIYSDIKKTEREYKTLCDKPHQNTHMQIEKQHLSFSELSSSDQIPYELLLLADPSKEMVNQYLKKSAVYVARYQGNIVGTLLLLPLSEEELEIKNLAVKTEYQAQGIGSYLIVNAIKTARNKKYSSICIGTSNSSIGQLYLYQKLGFDISEIKWDFFTINYPEPVYENGIRAKHMIMLSKDCSDTIFDN